MVAEHNGNRVTERNRNGEIVWEQRVPQPLAAQRLPNGNTFIATQTQFVEVDPSGKPVMTTKPRPSSSAARAAAKSRLQGGNGDWLTSSDVAGRGERRS